MLKFLEEQIRRAEGKARMEQRRKELEKVVSV